MFRYLPGLSKTVKSDIYYYNSEAMRKPVDMYSLDVIRTYKVLVSHWLEFSIEELAMKPFNGIHHFFLTPKLKLKSSDSVWFLKTLVEKNTLSKICKNWLNARGSKQKVGCSLIKLHDVLEFPEWKLHMSLSRRAWALRITGIL